MSALRQPPQALDRSLALAAIGGGAIALGTASIVRDGRKRRRDAAAGMAVGALAAMALPLSLRRRMRAAARR